MAKIIRGISLRKALGAARKSGCSVEHVRRTGEVRVRSSALDRPITVSAHRKDAPRVLIRSLRRLPLAALAAVLLLDGHGHVGAVSTPVGPPDLSVGARAPVPDQVQLNFRSGAIESRGSTPSPGSERWGDGIGVVGALLLIAALSVGCGMILRALQGLRPPPRPPRRRRLGSRGGRVERSGPTRKVAYLKHRNRRS